MGQNIELTTSCNICTSCGICKGICPKSCISFMYCDGMYIPRVDKQNCINCGMCIKICPGIKRKYPENKASVEALYGSYIKVYNAWSKDSILRHVSASGGVVTSVIKTLLEKGIYDVAFTLDTYSTVGQLKTVPVVFTDFGDDWEESTYPKSRYLPVSHEDAVCYIKENPEKRVIIVGTSCAITGMKKNVEIFKRELSQYLFIGLFCDSVFNYQVLNYFSDNLCENRSIESLHFKNKESGGWPGNMKLFYQDGSFEYKDKENRANAKKYFMPEACLYCIDKLNVNADISIGDNYTDQDSSELGSNTVIIRTSIGEEAWRQGQESVEYRDVDVSKLNNAQFLDGRLKNAYFGALKERWVKKKTGIDINLNEGIKLSERSVIYEQAWKQALSNIQAGTKYDHNKRLITCKPNKIMILLNRIYYKIKRSISKE